MTRTTRSLLPVLALVLAACQATTDPAGGRTEQPPTTSAPGSLSAPSPSASPVAESPGVGPDASLAAWQTIELTDVRTDERFTIAELAGAAVVIEPMAIWCTNCARQQREASTALTALPRDEVVYISLDIDPSERASDLAAYADDRGFDWRFVIAGREMSRALAEAFGDQVLSPPSTPKILVAPDGTVEGPAFGIQDAEAIEADIRDLLG